MEKIIEDGACGFRITDDDTAIEKLLANLKFNNTYSPNISRVHYCLGYVGEKDKDGKKLREVPVLATTIFWEDHTKTTVKNSLRDKIDVVKVEVKHPDGSVSKVETASEESKEIGLMYAIVKRFACPPDENGYVGNGFCSFLRKTIRKSFDQNVESVKIAKEKAIRKSSLNKAAKAKAKVRNPSNAEVVRVLAEFVKCLKNSK